MIKEKMRKGKKRRKEKRRKKTVEDIQGKLAMSTRKSRRVAEARSSSALVSLSRHCRWVGGGEIHTGEWEK